MANEEHEQINNNNNNIPTTAFNQHYYQQQQQQHSQPSLNLPDGSSSSPVDSKFQPFPAPEPGSSASASTPSSTLNVPSKTNNATGPSEFVKKLYKMLEEPESESVVGWGPQRTTLVIKDQILFQRDILPKHFKHSNFASFVRQLNKYDFRKIKVSSAINQNIQNNLNNTHHKSDHHHDQTTLGQPLSRPNHQNPGGSLQWEFYHPHFRADTLSELDHIKRKVPATRQKPVENMLQNESQSTTSCNTGTERTEDIVNRLLNHQIETTSALNRLSSECQNLRDKLERAHNRLDLQQRQIDLLTEANSRYSQPYLELTSQPFQSSLTSHSIKVFDQVVNPEETPKQLTKPLDDVNTSSAITPTQYYTTDFNLTMAPIPRPPTKSSRWPGQPRVLIVEDDQICRRISSTILELMGCQIEFACDGLNAVARMKTQIDANEPFDLVLMDIFMPNMDGLCATSLIRKFDLKTPIISMTSNFQPVDVLKYIDIGMNDCLPKPFTKEGMIIMLQKYLSNPWPDRNLITQGNESGSVSINLKRRSPPSSSTPPGSPQRSQLPSHQGLSSSITSSMTYLPDINRNMRRPGFSEEHVDLNNNNNNNNNNNPPLSDHRDQLDPSRFNFNLLDHFQDQNQAHNDTSSAEQHSQKRFKV